MITSTTSDARLDARPPHGAETRSSQPNPAERMWRRVISVAGALVGVSSHAQSSTSTGRVGAAATEVYGVIWVLAGAAIVALIAFLRPRRKFVARRAAEQQSACESMQLAAKVAELNRELSAARRQNEQHETKIAELQKQLVAVSHQAGTAEVATSVLHNVGNVLNSVNVSATLVVDKIRASKVSSVPKLGALLADHQADLATFLVSDPRGQKIPTYVDSLGKQLLAEQEEVMEELTQLRKNIEHIKEIVALQQTFAKVSGVSEHVALSELMEDSVRMNSGALERHQVELIRDYQAPIHVTIERHKVIQILINLVRNAKYACDESGRTDKRIILRTAEVHGRIQISVIDNGVGISPENLRRIFVHGFTTRKEGHGFGLHSCAVAAKDLGGRLTAHSAGVGHGATFILDLPLQHAVLAAPAASPDLALAAV